MSIENEVNKIENDKLWNQLVNLSYKVKRRADKVINEQQIIREDLQEIARLINGRKNKDKTEYETGSE